MVARKNMASLALMLATVIVSGCSRTTAPAPQATKPLSASAVASAALVGVWAPASPASAKGLNVLDVRPDGTVSVSLTTTDAVGGGPVSGTFSGSWHATGSASVVMSRELSGIVNGTPMPGPTATYAYSRSGDALTLRWASGRRPGAVSYGPVHFDFIESESWITGTSGSLRLVLRH